MHDPRVGRFFAPDPLEPKYPFYSPYQFSGNRLIDMVELEGLEPKNTKDKEASTPSPGFPGSDKPIELEEIVVQGKVKSPTASFSQRFANMSASLAAVNRGQNQWQANGKTYTQVTGNTLIIRDNNFATEDAGEYSFILPQSYGSWGQEGSDGRIWIGCMSCHSPNGAYSYAAYNSQERLGGILASNLLNLGVTSRLLSGGVPKNEMVTVGQWMSSDELSTFTSTGIIPRTNVLTKGMQGYLKQANAGDIYVEFQMQKSLLVEKNAELGWSMVKSKNQMYIKLAQKKGEELLSPIGTNIKAITTKK